MFHPDGPTFLELAHQALSSTRRGYDMLAPKFDRTPFRTPDEWILPALEEVGPVDDAVDLCCGTGAAIRLMQPYARERLVGVDFSEGMLAESKRNVAMVPGEAEVEFFKANVLDLPFEEEFDLAVCFGALGHIVGRDEATFLDQVHGALRPGGKFVFITSDYPPIWSIRRAFSHLFNWAFRVRNLILKPEFIMYFLTFQLPEIARTLERHGFRVEVRERPELGRFKIVIAERAS